MDRVREVASRWMASVEGGLWGRRLAAARRWPGAGRDWCGTGRGAGFRFVAGARRATIQGLPRKEVGIVSSVASGGGKAATHPSGDNRFKMLDASMKRHRFSPDALIEVLHTAQELFGYLKIDLLVYIAQGLKLPPSRVFGVATFYHFFTFKPKGDHTCVVCMGTACYVKGAEAVLDAMREFAQAETRAGSVSVEAARCLGACGLAPVAVFDGEVVGNLNPGSTLTRMKGWVKNGSQ
jgi:bidirectional [NiFe] hydrogenase diaphorase subunit